MYTRAFKQPISAFLVLLPLAVGLIPNLANAQTSAGQLLQQNRELEIQQPILPEAMREIAPTKISPLKPKPGQVSFVTKQFKFVGNTKVSNDELQVIVKEFLNKSIAFEDLTQITDAISEYYRARGWFARAIIPQQDITEGNIEIRIVEAKLGGIKIDNKSKNVSDARVEDWIYARIPKATELSLDELDRAILTLNDLPDIEVVSSLQEGAQPGETILLLTVVDKPLVNGQAAIDNFGDKNSGTVRASAQVNVNGPLGIGDQLSAYAMYSQGNAYGRVGFTVPAGTSGLRVGVSGSSMSYRVLNSSFQSLNANGVANTGGLEATYPVLRSRMTNVIATAYWNYNQFKNWNINGLNQDQTYDTSVGQFGFSGNHLDGFLGGGLNTGSLIASFGDIGRNASGQYNGFYNVAGNFAKLRYSFNRNQAINDTLSFYFSISGQQASKNMDSSEQMYLGGPMNVRAYGSGQGAASQANITTLELRQVLPYQTQLTAFYDLGNIQTWKFNNPTVNGTSNNYALQGLGLSLAWMGPYGFNVKAVWAHRTGPLSQSVTTYLTQNGGISSDRFWINASIPF